MDAELRLPNISSTTIDVQDDIKLIAISEPHVRQASTFQRDGYISADVTSSTNVLVMSLFHQDNVQLVCGRGIHSATAVTLVRLQATVY